MPTKAFALPEWRPDLGNTGTLTIAKNVRAIANGYAPVQSFSAITPNLGNPFYGGGAFVSSTGVANLLVASSTALRRYSGATWTNIISVTGSNRWYFTQFGDNIIYANAFQLGSYNMLTGTAAVISGAPNATDVVTVRDFVVALVDGDSAVGWSGFNNSAQWPMDGTNQSDKQPLLSGGLGVKLVGGEYGLVLKKNGISRMTYVGGDTIFQFDEISTEIGCMARGSVASAGKMVFFISERGFEMCDGQSVQPIGDEKFNRWFFNKFSRKDIGNVWAAIDPRYSEVKWAMQGSPGLLISYNWVLQKATVTELGVAGIFTGFTANTSLDAVDALYPGGLEAIPISLDDSSLNGGNPLLLLATDTNIIGSLTGPNMAATVQMDNLEPSPGRRSRVRAARLVTDAVTMSARLDARMRAGDAEHSVNASTPRLNGKMPVRGANGRYIDVTAMIPAGASWSYLQAIELEYESGEGR